LSYVWGDPTPVRRIEINGVTAKITESLHEALMAIRDNTSVRVIWADALSINQQDKTEKSWQVQQMMDIYKCATAVLAWLGPASDDSSIAIAALHKLSKLLRKKSFRKPWYRKTDAPPTVYAEFLLWTMIDKFFTGREREYNAIVSLSRRAYWTRVWIIQEVVLAQDISFLCGSSRGEEIQTALFAIHNASVYFAKLAGSLNKASSNLKPIMQGIMYMMNERSPRFFVESGSATQIQNRNLYHLLFYCRLGLRYRASNPRDYIYAMLGMAADRESLRIIPDYKKPPELLYSEVARSLISAGYTDALSLAVSTKTLQGLPSWVPDFSNLAQVFFCTFRTAQQESNINPTVPSQEDGSTLTLRGSVIGVITHLAPAPSLDDSSELSFTRSVHAWLLEVEAEILFDPSSIDSIFANNPDPFVLPMTRTEQDRDRLARSLCAMRDMNMSFNWNRGDPERCYRLLQASFSDQRVNLRLELNFLRGGIESRILAFYMSSIVGHARVGCRAYRLSSGHLGLASPGCRVGDKVVHIPGGSFPFLMRPIADGGLEIATTATKNATGTPSVTPITGTGPAKGDTTSADANRRDIPRSSEDVGVGQSGYHQLVGITYLDGLERWLTRKMPVENISLR
jgi:hypothetical protein